MLSPGREEWLLVLDNYDDIQVDLQRCLPLGAIGSVLITSRDRRVVGSVAKSGLALSAMGLMDAKNLFIRIRSCNDDSPDSCVSPVENEVLDEILQELQCFPLAIDQAASFIRENSPMTLREYLGYLKPRTVDRERLMRFKEANPRYPESVMTTWEISLQYLEQNQPRASWILQILGFLNHSHISEELLTRATGAMSWTFDSDFDGRRLPADLHHEIRYLKNDVEFRIAIGTLTSLSLVQRNLSGPTISVHPLVHEWTRVRLNANPIQQAKFAIAAATVLYQSFPLELAGWLPVQFPTMSADIHRRIDEVSQNLRNAVDNLRDYHSHVVTTPLECFTLLEAIHMTGLPKHSIYAFDLSNEFLIEVDRTIKAIIPCLTQSQQSLALYIHKVAAWLRIDSKTRKSLKIPNQIAESLESLSFTPPVDESMAMFFMLLATVVIDCAECATDSIKDDQVIDQMVEHPKGSLSQHAASAAHVERKDLHRNTGLRLLDTVHKVIAPFQKVSRLIRWIVFMVELRLLDTLTPAVFAARDDLRKDLMLSTEILCYLDFDHRAGYLSQLTHLYWDCPWPKDYAAIKTLFALARSEGKARLTHEQQQLEAQKDGDNLRRWSRNEYVSSSFGRSEDTSRRENPKWDLITPLNYFWTITLEVAEAVSDPFRHWRPEGGRRDECSRLDLQKRKWALELIVKTKKLYERILEAQGREGSKTEASFLDHFQNDKVIPTLTIIQTNLENWAQAEGDIWDALRCDDILALQPLPWEYRNASVRYPSAFPIRTRLENAQARSDRSPEASEEVDGDQWRESPDIGPITSHAEACGTASLHSENSMDHLRIRLEAVASERLALNERLVVQRGTGRAIHILEKLGIPLASEFLYNDRVHDMIHNFITLCWRQGAISEGLKTELTSQSNFVASVPKLAPRCLGWLELIYRLASSYLLKVARTDIGRFAPDRSWVDSKDDSPDSSADEGLEESEDTLPTGEMSGENDFEWDW